MNILSVPNKKLQFEQVHPVQLDWDVLHFCAVKSVLTNFLKTFDRWYNSKYTKCTIIKNKHQYIFNKNTICYWPNLFIKLPQITPQIHIEHDVFLWFDIWLHKWVSV